MKTTERDVYYYDLEVRTWKNATAPHGPRVLVQRLHTTLYPPDGTKRFLFHKRDHGNITLILRDVVIDTQQDLAILFLGKSDKLSPSHAYSDIQTGVLDIYEKTAQQAGEVTLHVVIDLQHQPERPRHHLCLLEGMDGFNHRGVVSLLNALLREVAKGEPPPFTLPPVFTAVATATPPVGKRYTPRIVLSGHVSDELVQELEAGTDQRVELVRDTLQSSLGNDPYLQKTKMALEVRVADNAPKQGLYDRIVNGARTKRTSFNKIKVKFTDVNGRDRTVDLDAETGALEQQRYVRRARISPISPPVSSMATAEIVDRIAEPMIDLVLAER